MTFKKYMEFMRDLLSLLERMSDYPELNELELKDKYGTDLSNIVEPDESGMFPFFGCRCCAKVFYDWKQTVKYRRLKRKFVKVI